MQPSTVSLPGGELEVGVRPSTRPRVFLAVERRRTGPVLPGQFEGVGDTHPPLFRRVDEEQAAERPERLAAEVHSRLLIDDDHTLACGYGLSRRDESASPHPMTRTSVECAEAGAVMTTPLSFRGGRADRGMRRALRPDSRRFEGVHHRERCTLEVVPERGLVEGRSAARPPRCAYDVPPVAGVGVHVEGHVAHSQTRVAALLAVRRRTAPVLREEEREALRGGPEVFFGIHGSQHLVLCHLAVEDVDEACEGLVPSHLLIEAMGVARS